MNIEAEKMWMYKWFFLLLGLFFASVSPGQEALYVKDLIDLNPVDSARVVYFIENQEDSRLIGFTDKQGKVILGDSLPRDRKNFYFEITHPSYHPLQISYKKARDRSFGLFLESTSFELSDVVFTASKFQTKKSEVAQQVSVLTQKEIQLANPQTSADLLTFTGNVFVQKSQMGGGSPNLRGFEANKVLLVVDGVRLNNAIYRSGHLQNVLTIDPSIVARAEVLFGPASVIYGSDALGGVMHFYTLRPEVSTTGKVETQTHISSRYSSANREKRIHGHIHIGGEKWASLTSLSLMDFGDLRVGIRRGESFEGLGIRDSFVVRKGEEDKIIANDDPNRQVATGYRQLDFLQKILYLPSPYQSHTLNFQLSSSTDIPRYDRLTQERDGRLRFAEWYYGPQERLLTAYHFHHTRPSLLWEEVKVTTAFQKIQESRNSRSLNADWLNLRVEDLYIGSLNLDVFKNLGQGSQLSYGLEIVSNRVLSEARSENIINEEIRPLDTRYPDGGSWMNTYAAYATFRQRWNDHLLMRAGLRWTLVDLTADFEDNSFYSFPFSTLNQRNQAPSGSLEFIYQSGSFWEVGWTAGTGFRAPNLDDVAKVFDSQPGNVVFPNPDIDPEYTYNSDFSLRLKIRDKVFVEWTAFGSYYDQAIVVRDAGVDSVIYEGMLSNVQTNVNAKEAFLMGSSLGMKVDLEPFHFFSSFNWTFGDVIQTGEPNVPLSHIPPLFGRSHLEYKRDKFYLRFEAVYQGWKRLNRFSPRDFNNIDAATPEGWPSWIIFNFRSNYKLSKHLEVDLGVENILDQHYRPFSSRISAAGRNIYTAFRLNF